MDISNANFFFVVKRKRNDEKFTTKNYIFSPKVNKNWKGNFNVLEIQRQLLEETVINKKAK